MSAAEQRRKFILEKRARLLQDRGVSAQKLDAGQYNREKKKITTATRRSYERTLYMYVDFLVWSGCTQEEAVRSVSEGASVPATDRIKQFFEWWVASSNGLIGDTVTIDSALTLWWRLRASIERFTGSQFSKAQNNDTRGFIQGTLRTTYNLENTQREEGYADEVDLTNLMMQLWCYDTTEIKDERSRVQLSLMILIMYYSGGRTGAFLSTAWYKDQCLMYQHVTLLLVRVGKKQQLALRISEEFMKGRKDAPSGNLQLVWLEEANPLECPVLFFLALAFADNAFRDFNNASELFQVALHDQDSLVFHWKEEKTTEPIFKTARWTAASHEAYLRHQKACVAKEEEAHTQGPEAVLAGIKSNAQHGSMLSPFWTVSTFRFLLRQLSFRAGYSRHIIPYFIRKGVLNRLNESNGVSASQQNQIAGHTRLDQNTYISHYQSSLSAVDVQGHVLRQEARSGFDTVVRELRRIPRHSNTVEDSMYQPEQARPSMLENSFKRLGSLQSPGTRMQVFFLLHEGRNTIRRAIQSGGYSLRQGHGVLQCMINICSNPSMYDAYYSGAEPLTNTLMKSCQDCHRDLKQIRHPKLHLLKCARKRMSRPGMTAKYCFRCQEWLTSNKAIREHMQQHWQELDMFCGSLYIRGLRISEHRCPFCMSSEGAVREFPSSDRFAQHLQEHFESAEALAELPCPHPLCLRAETPPTGSPQHLRDEHGIEEATDNLLEQQRRHKCSRCWLSFVSEERRDRHEVDSHQVNGYVCEKCKTGFDSLSRFRYHKRVCRHPGTTQSTQPQDRESTALERQRAAVARLKAKRIRRRERARNDMNAT